MPTPPTHDTIADTVYWALADAGAPLTNGEAETAAQYVALHLDWEYPPSHDYVADVVHSALVPHLGPDGADDYSDQVADECRITWELTD